ncbi:hypothetical protein FQR65_LT13244 [Abscondita terminalis]|nr:hypothetical protein FQR65_LT13244 [Abscondita terminalis]
MHQPENFQVLYNGLKNVTQRILDKHHKRIQWKEGKLATVVDIGSASGETTKNILYPYIEENLKMLVGIDVSHDMIKFANDHYSSSKLQFHQGDVQSEEFVNTYRNAFDHVFSFWCLHWINDKKKAFSNIWEIMRPGGDILLSFAPSANIFDVCRKVQHSPTWMSYLKNGSHAISPTSECENGLHALQELLERLGFTVNLCESDEGVLKFNEKDFEIYLIIVHPYYETLSDELKKSFLQEHKNEMMKSNFIEYTKNGEIIYVITFQIITVYAEKVTDQIK